MPARTNTRSLAATSLLAVLTILIAVALYRDLDIAGQPSAAIVICVLGAIGVGTLVVQGMRLAATPYWRRIDARKPNPFATGHIPTLLDDLDTEYEEDADYGYGEDLRKEMVSQRRSIVFVSAILGCMLVASGVAILLDPKSTTRSTAGLLVLLAVMLFALPALVWGSLRKLKSMDRAMSWRVRRRSNRYILDRGNGLVEIESLQPTRKSVPTGDKRHFYVAKTAEGPILLDIERMNRLE